MARIEWTAAAIRVIAVWVWVGLLSQLPATVTTSMMISPAQAGGFSGSQYLAVALLSAAVIAVLGLALWTTARGIAGAIWRGLPMDAPSNGVSIAAVEFQQALIAVLGIWLLVGCLTDLAALAPSIQGSYSLRNDDRWSQQISGHLASLAVQLVAGLTLMLGSRRVVGLLQRLRTAGLRPDA